MLRHAALIVPLTASESHVGAATGLYERVLLEHGCSLETIAAHRQATLDNLHTFRFHHDEEQHLTRRTDFYRAYYKDHPHAMGDAEPLD